jgi:drug/metabolite transporter (DMT)-like permease
MSSRTKGRWFILAAALLWSLNSLFVKLLTLPNATGLHEPPVSGPMLGLGRCVGATFFLACLLRGVRPRWTLGIASLALCFAIMNFVFLTAMAMGKAAKAIFLQYTSPLWVFLLSTWFLGERIRPRDPLTILGLTVGLFIIVGGGLGDSLLVTCLGVASGVTFAGVIVGLRRLAGEDARWLTFVNHAATIVVLLPVVLWWDAGRPWPTAGQLVVLGAFGAVQLALPYLLMTRGLQMVTASDAGLITLVEPILSTLWAWLVFGESPDVTTVIGAALIMAALVYRFWPSRGSTPVGTRENPTEKGCPQDDPV